MDKKVLAAILVILAAALFLGRGYLFQAFQTSNPSFYIITGSYTSSNSVDASGSANIGGYTIAISSHSQYNYYTGSGQCKANTCGGTQTSTDASNCPIYTAPASSAFYRCDSGNCCGSDTQYGQYHYCQIFSQGQQCTGGVTDTYGGSCQGSVGCHGAIYPLCSYHSSSTPTCGGIDRVLQTATGCGIGMTVTNASGIVYDSGSNFYPNSIGQVNLQGLSIIAPSSSTFDQLQNCVNQMVRVTPVIPSDSFDIEISPQHSSYYQRENATIGITITSNYSDTLGADITTTVCAPSFAGDVCKDYTTSKNIVRGINTLSYSIPTAAITDKLTVKTTASIYYNVNSLSGLNADCSGSLQKASGCVNKIVIATVTSDTKTIMVIPRPLVMQPPCNSGYTLKNNQCLSNDVLNLNLNCLVLGCPNVQGALYSCTSAGVCAETIVQTVIVNQDCNTFGCPTGMTCAKDQSNNAYCLFIKSVDVPVDCKTTGCDSGLTCVTSQTGSSYCLKTQIQNIDCSTTGCSVGMTCVTSNTSQPYCLRSEFVNVISQCKVASDCMIPCSGVNVNCNNGVCDYSGSCTPVSVGCQQLGCNEGYTCTDRNVCEKTTILNTITNVIPVWVWVLIAVLAIILVILALRRK